METKLMNDNPRSPAILRFTAGAFLVAAVAHLLLTHWLDAAFFLAGGAIFLFGRRIERMPRAVRYLIVVAFGALAVAMFVELIIRARALR